MSLFLNSCNSWLAKYGRGPGEQPPPPPTVPTATAMYMCFKSYRPVFVYRLYVSNAKQIQPFV